MSRIRAAVMPDATRIAANKFVRIGFSSLACRQGEKKFLRRLAQSSERCSARELV
jgi:hypothetical protein